MSADAHRELIRALARRLGPLEKLTSRSRDWSSVMFTGMQHELRFQLPHSDEVRAALATLADAELPMRRHFVADLRLVSVMPAGPMLDVKVEALTIIEA